MADQLGNIQTALYPEKPGTCFSFAENVKDFLTAVIMPAAQSNFRIFGSIAPQAILFVRRDPDKVHVARFETVRAFQLSFSPHRSPEMKTARSHLIRCLAIDLEAVGAVWLDEAWITELKSDAALEEFQKYRDGGGTVRDLPESQRREVLFMTLEHVELPETLVWFSQIHRPKKRSKRAWAGDFESSPGSPFTGQMVDFLSYLRPSGDFN